MSRIVAVGLPQAGKTSFLAAIWEIVNNSEVAGSLNLENLHGDVGYLNKIRDTWSRCIKIDRTVEDQPDVSMLLKSEERALGEVFFTDMSGESFEKQWLNRVWTAEYQNLIESATGLLLFVHPTHVKETSLIREALKIATAIDTPQMAAARKAASDRLISEVGAPAASEFRVAETENATCDTSAANAISGPSGNCETSDGGVLVLPQLPTYASTQVQLVELLQFIARYLGNIKALRIGIVISAWDLVLATGSQTPEKWLSARLPLLDQYLASNLGPKCVRTFGVSEIGGNLPQEEKRLRSYIKTSERLICEDRSYKGPDITRPLRWALSCD